MIRIEHASALPDPDRVGERLFVGHDDHGDGADRDHGRDPAPPPQDLPAVPQPPPPPRVNVENEVLVLDEALGFDEAGKLAAEHADIVAEIASWLARNEDVLELSIEVSSAAESGRRKQDKRNKALAGEIVAALVAEGIDAARLLPVSVGKSEDGLVHVVLRVSKRAGEGFTLEE